MLQPLKKSRQLFRTEIREYFSIHLQHRCHFLAGKADHFLKGRVIGDDINLFVLDVLVVEPADRLVAPSAIWLDKQSNFHHGNIHLPCPFNKLYSSSVTVDDRHRGPNWGECVQGSQFRVLGSEARILECAGMTALWNDATCRVGGKRRPVAALQKSTLNGLNRFKNEVSKTGCF